MEKEEPDGEVHQPEMIVTITSASQEENFSTIGLVKNLALLECLLKNNMIDFISK